MYIQHNMITINEIFFIHTTSSYHSFVQISMGKGGMTLSVTKNSLFLSAFFTRRQFPHPIKCSHRKKAHDDIHLFSLKLHNQTSSSSLYKREYNFFLFCIESKCGEREKERESKGVYIIFSIVMSIC